METEKVICKKWDIKTKEWVEFTGLFHGWGVDYDEFDAGPGNYTCGIVEKEDGQIELVHAGSIRFAEPNME